MTSYPFWVTPATLPSRSEGYSYSSNPEILLYGETASLPCTVSIPPINGALPPGTRIDFTNGTIRILGQITDVKASQTYSFTLRLTNGAIQNDRTFYIPVSNIEDILQWTTPTDVAVGYYSESGKQDYVIRAENIPPKAITYAFGPYTGWTSGLSIESDSGIVSLDLSWLPTNTYTTVDYVINNNFLYVCSIAGKSGRAGGPLSPGSNVVDTTEQPWQPSSYYTINTIVAHDLGKLYVCLAAGVSGVTGPAGTGNSIPDGGVIWRYTGQAAVWNQIPSSTILPITFSVVATTNTESIQSSWQINVISRPYPPIWQTQARLLLRLDSLQYFTIQLEIFDPDNDVVSFSSPNLPQWINLGPLGSLWGRAPATSSAVEYVFTIIATDGINSVPRDFSLVVGQTIENIIWENDSNLGVIKDGELSSIQFIAKTVRPGASISYGLSGGMIPPETIVVDSTGMLSGFVEYHAVDKTYYFEITAYDGVEKNTKWFQLTVQSQNLEKFISLSIPITGTEKLQFEADNNSSLIKPEYLFREIDETWSKNNSPSVSIVKGIKYTNLARINNTLRNWLTDFNLLYDALDVSLLPSLEYQTLFVKVKDSNSVTSWQPFTTFATNERVSLSSGLQLFAVVGGKTGDYPEPVEPGTDGSVVWQEVAFPNEQTDTPYALPWYASHRYEKDQTVSNFGRTYIALNGGISSGGLGPRGTGAIVDYQIVWVDSGSIGPNVAYPSSVYNIRQQIIKEYGFSNAKGKSATAYISVSASGNITSVSVTNPGIGYFSPPYVDLIGPGTGAEFSVELKLISSEVGNSAPRFSPGEEYIISQGRSKTQNWGKLRIATVDSVGRVKTVEIIDAGTYSLFPQAPIVFGRGNKTFSVNFELGVAGISVINGGTDYTASTRLSLNGKEMLPDWQRLWAKNFVLSVPLASITLEGAKAFKLSTSITNPYQGHVIEAKSLMLSVQGLVWMGDTTFDDDCMTWECDATQMVEYESADQLEFDQGLQTFDKNFTVFDFHPMITTAFGKTNFDEDRTLFDYYATIFDTRSVVSQSKFNKTWLLNFGIQR